MSGTCAGGCGCGGGSAVGVARDGVFTRPTFFDGQLLCADDLQALVAYTRGKDRLHNRYLVGSGVVCGLEVVCSRSRPGSVLVRAGYALDCCGNDIVVSCDQTVDITKLIADLPRDADCIPPCPPPVPDPERGKPTNASALPRHYELVVEYAETPGDLVAPFSTGEERSRGCEPTRFHEGYRFSLRCRTARPACPPTLVGAVACCAEAERRLAELEKVNEAARALVTGGHGSLPAAPSDKDLDDAKTQLAAPPELGRAVRLAGMVVRLAAGGKVDAAKGALEAVRGALGSIRAAAGDDPLASAQVDALEEQIDSLGGRLEAFKQTRADRLLAEGIVSGKQVDDTVRSTILDARDWALSWLEQRPSTHCRSEERLAQLRVSADDPVEELSNAALAATAAVRQILLDCICAAINPPCVPCDDAAVALAVVTVEGCEVVEICNLVRRHALTGSALRYWLPIEWAYSEIEKSCCGDADSRRILARVRGTAQALAALDECGRTRGSEEEPQADGERRLLTMLNSQLQSMQAKIRKLEEQLGEADAHG